MVEMNLPRCSGLQGPHNHSRFGFQNLRHPQMFSAATVHEWLADKDHLWTLLELGAWSLFSEPKSASVQEGTEDSLYPPG